MSNADKKAKNEDKKQLISLYIHIPFCDKKCYYCDFKSFASSTDTLKANYVNALCSEITKYSKYCKDKYVSTIYFGGGTPSVLSSEQFSQIVKTIKSEYIIDDDLEFTVEVNPESVNLEKVNNYKYSGVNRVSIGLQTTDDILLKKIGRLHSYVQFLSVYEMFKAEGFTNISVDIISNLIGQSLESYKDTIEKVTRLKPEHISSYSLMIEEGTAFYSMIKSGKLVYDERNDRQMYAMTGKMLKNAGYEHYEISNYCLDKKVSKHNLNYWELGESKGFGISAASFIGRKRYKNIDSIQEYIKADGNIEKINVLEYVVNDKAYLEEMMFLGLRKLKGIRIKNLYNFADMAKNGTYKKEIEKKIEKQIAKGNLELNKDMLSLTSKGIDFSNACFSELLLD